MDCIFCKIISKEIPAEIVYEDEEVISFLDIQPVSKGHTLLIPKKHSRNLLNMTKNELRKMERALIEVPKAVKRGVGAEGLVISTNNEPPAGQVVFHTHFHIIPRWENDGLEHWPQGKLEPEESTKIGEQIRNSF